VLTVFKKYFTVVICNKFAAKPFYISRRNLSVSLHYLVTYRRSKIAKKI